MISPQGHCMLYDEVIGLECNFFRIPYACFFFDFQCIEKTIFGQETNAIQIKLHDTALEIGIAKMA